MIVAARDMEAGRNLVHGLQGTGTHQLERLPCTRPGIYLRDTGVVRHTQKAHWNPPRQLTTPSRARSPDPNGRSPDTPLSEDSPG